MFFEKKTTIIPYPEISSTFKKPTLPPIPLQRIERIHLDSEGSKRLGAESLESSRLGAFLNDSTPTGELVVAKMITPGDV